MVWKALGRLVAIPAALLAAAATAAAVVLTLGLERVTHAMHGQEGEAIVDLAFNALRDGSLILAGATILPALAIIVIGEVARIRSMVYYVVGGGVALAAWPLLAGVTDAGGLSSPVWLVMATAGFAGGLVYWLIAGRWT